MSIHPPAQLFPDQHWRQLLVQLDSLTEQQRLWLSGYLAGGANVTSSQPKNESAETVTIAFGTETDNCRRLAEKFHNHCREAGISANVVDMASLRVRKLARLKYLVVITATHGDGDSPEPISDFYEALMADDGPSLNGLRFAVLALGDSSYEQFCVTGQRIDQRLKALGGERLISRRDCDVDFEHPAREWMVELLGHLPESGGHSHQAVPVPPADNKVEYSKNQPLEVEVLANHNLSSPQRQKPIHHLELALPGVEFSVDPGDAIGVLPENPPELVAAILDGTGLSGEQSVTLDDNAMPLVEALRKYRDLTIPGRGFLSAWESLTGDRKLLEILEGDTRVQRTFLREHQILDLIRESPARPEPQTLVDALRPLQPRLYDVANSLSVVDDELHLTVKAFHYPFRDRQETGITSRYLLELQPGDSLWIYPHRNARFHLPDDPEAPLILVAEGTGIAPYRAFLQALSLRDSIPPCWLVFGEQRFEEDFLYQLDLQQALAGDLLCQLDAVFYTDQPKKDLANPLLEKADQLTDWLKRGGHLYLGGEKEPLEDCESRLQACLDDKLGKGYWKSLTKAKRVHRNLY